MCSMSMTYGYLQMSMAWMIVSSSNTWKVILGILRRVCSHVCWKVLQRSLKNCCTDHSTIKCGKRPLRFGGKSPQSLSEAENRFGEKHLKRKLRAVPGCRCQIAQNHYQKERDQTKKYMASKTTFTTDDISTRRATPSLSIAYLRVDDNSRLWKGINVELICVS